VRRKLARLFCRYLVDAVTCGWLDGWRAAGWRRGKEELKNPDLWQELDRLLHVHTVNMIWVKGHDGHPYNERCDAIATDNAARYVRNEKLFENK
jgi:ribonuclease HI